ncbi:MAG: hypothetical protein QM778_14500 [Myxococcales bacterium]
MLEGTLARAIDELESTVGHGEVLDPQARQVVFVACLGIVFAREVGQIELTVVPHDGAHARVIHRYLVEHPGQLGDGAQRLKVHEHASQREQALVVAVRKADVLDLQGELERVDLDLAQAQLASVLVMHVLGGGVANHAGHQLKADQCVHGHSD